MSQFVAGFIAGVFTVFGLAVAAATCLFRDEPDPLADPDNWGSQ